MNITEHSLDLKLSHSFAFRLPPPAASSPVNVVVLILGENDTVEFYFQKCFPETNGIVLESFPSDFC